MENNTQKSISFDFLVEKKEETNLLHVKLGQ